MRHTKAAAQTLVLASLALALGACLREGERRYPTKDSAPIFFVRLHKEPYTLDPHLAFEEHAPPVLLSLFEGLFSYDPKTGKAIPGLAARWSVDVGGDLYTFSLREARWSDGVPITAQTVHDSWLRLLHPETASPYAWLATHFIAGAQGYHDGKTSASSVEIRVVNSRTLRVRFTVPSPHLPEILAHHAFSPVPLHMIRRHGREWVDPLFFVGNGPFLLSRRSPGQEIFCLPNTQYWDKENVSLGGVSYLIVESANTSYSMFRKGELDWSRKGIPSERATEVLHETFYKSAPLFGSNALLLNTKRTPLDQHNVRRALALAIDKGQYLHAVWKTPLSTTGRWVPSLAGYPSPRTLSFHPQKARELLAEAGYPEGKGFPQLIYLYPANGHTEFQVEIHIQMWEEILGVHLVPMAVEWLYFLSRMQTNDYDIAFVSQVGDYLDPASLLSLFLSDATTPFSPWRSLQYDDLLTRALHEKEQSTRMSLLSRAEAFLIERVPLIPLYPLMSVNLIDLDRWGGWYVNIMDVHPTKTIHLKQDTPYRK